MQKLDLQFQAPELMSDYTADFILGPDPRITIEKSWDALVAPVDDSDFDFSTPIKPILVNAQDGKLVIVDGRRRFLAYKKANLHIPYCIEHWSRLRAKDEFLMRHKPLS